jgi:type II secretory pathway pseudopilin PulG
MEQLVVIAIFAICAAVCVKIISVAYGMTEDAVDTRHALAAAENAAENFKAGVAQAATVYYNENWQPVSAEAALFAMFLEERDDENSRVIFMEISVRRIIDDEELIRLSAAVRRAQ